MLAAKGDLYSTRGVLVQLMPHVYRESPFPIKSTNEILQSYSYPSQARYLELGILEQLESSASTRDRKEMINEFVQHNLLCAVAIILLACMYPYPCIAAYQKGGSAEPPLPPLNPPLPVLC